MYQKVESVRLKNGESAELGVLTGPDSSEQAQQLRALLGHKGAAWRWQIEQSLTQSATSVSSRFYVLSKEGRPFANIMCVQSRGVGIFGHVYTHPDERRKGAADIIHAYQIEDFKRRGGRALYLGTDYDSHPYRLYARHGFLGVEPGSGYMYYFAQGQEAFEREVFAPASVRVEPLSFEHWPTLPALAMMRHPARVRIAGMNVINVRSTEGGSLPYLVAMAEPAKANQPSPPRAWVAVSETSHMPVAIACSTPDSVFNDDCDLVDVFCAPGFEASLPPLLEKLELCGSRSAICYVDPFWPEKMKVLSGSAFQEAGRLPKHFQSRGQACDVTLWRRGPR
ncbi:MAG TPA: GNAT family N-acetyltransferase [Planctomycetota bacterium]|nr:GNAT family N-acetyltransferase [Planctomycetota bacterium]